MDTCGLAAAPAMPAWTAIPARYGHGLQRVLSTRWTRSATLVAMYGQRMLASTVVALLVVSACSGNHDSSSVSEPSTAASLTESATPVASASPEASVPLATSAGSVSTAGPVRLSRADAKLEVSIQQLHGGVDRDERPQLRKAVSKPIVSWIDGAFAQVDPQTHGVGAAFAGWTPQAAALARDHRDVTTNAALGTGLTGVILDKRRVRLFVFAVDGVVGGATATVTLRAAGVQADGSENDISVAGELYLTRAGSRWQIFGYDLQSRRQLP